MKYSVAILATVASLVSAQSIGDIPGCALTCVVSAASTVGCSATDIACACKAADKLTPAIQSCPDLSKCSTAEQSKLITVLTGLCAKEGITINPPSPGGSSTAAPSSAATSAASSAATTPASSGAASTPASSGSKSSAAATTAKTSGAASPSNGTTGGNPPVPTATGAAGKAGVSFGAVAAVFAGALYAL